MTPPLVSFEFFPPTTAKMEQALWASVTALERLSPRFVSVTYGADGSTRDRTHRIVQRIHNETSLVCAPHLTCVGASREDILEIAEGYLREGIAHLVALRGDPPKDAGPYTPRSDGFAYATDLVAGLRQLGRFDISVAAYPETHPEAPSASFDLDNLKRKLDAGASRAITQFFFDVDTFLKFRDRCAAHGIDAPIVPGILPIVNFERMLGFAATCGTAIPDWLSARFAAAEDKGTEISVARDVAIEQTTALRDAGVSEFHFYTLNRAELTLAVCEALGIVARPESAVV
jgi:methylenetetrahydrofolate reductase (NADPH)